ncbi:MAG TPA: hypothetical protein VNZ26_17965, partial [Vicinamibacterales bacterium]|nr:hypothetical protein [Vicinamibacterales bacterium]
VLALLSPYILRGDLSAFVNGALILPQKRIAFASMAMPPADSALMALPLIVLVFVEPRYGWLARSRLAWLAVWLVAIVLPVTALRVGHSYQAMWQSTRAFAAFLPIGIVSQLAAGEAQDPPDRMSLLMMASTLAWASLNQYPFSAPIYFNYVAPLAVVAAIAAVGRGRITLRGAMAPWAVSLILFAVLSTNRGYIRNLGLWHETQSFNSPLVLPRAHLRVSWNEAWTYRRVIALIQGHLHGGQLAAGPDCPEVYFLAGLVNPSGALFDFFSAADGEDATRWSKADMIVVNHQPGFSPPPSDRLMATLRQEFTYGQRFGQFEVRWR